MDENDTDQQNQQQSQQLDLSQSQITHTANGWQVISACATSTANCNTSTSQGLCVMADDQKNRLVVSSGAGVQQQQQQQQYVMAPTVQGQQVLTTLSGVMPNIQYQVIPQFQTVDGQQLQLAQAQQDPSAVGAGQFQLVSSPNGGQQLIAAANRSATAGNILTVPGLIQQAIPLQNLGLGNAVLPNQTQFLANMPVSLNGNITLLPVSAGVPATAGGDGGGGATGNNQQLMQQQQQQQQQHTAVSSVGSNYYTSSITTTSTPTATTYGVASQGQSTNTVVTGTFQNATGGISIQSDGQQQQQQQILIQPQQILSGTPTLQAIQPGTVTTAGGQVFATPTISQDGLQNLQIQALPNSSHILLRTVGPNGQVSWQTIQLQNPGGAQITLAPVQSLPQLAQTQTGGTVQLQGLQTINLNPLGNTGLQMHQLQGVPIAIANPAG